ncbi:hypothetical protein GCK72_026046 [Caenorhabditis remanei]|uniref:NTF2-like domain-containing protein n=1 Tax=Caenorhabditis remanei TaxID=31234 RepID=A0A6A5G3K8_CAERE|nr:hypothetical protein GCK72_026046 [Caenorhabditis remanei]KAF1749578.1 hypothetical protein GCK72_026046 [Caenorhabditis remanei]
MVSLFSVFLFSILLVGLTYGSASKNATDFAVQKFLDRMEKAIRSENKDDVARLFSPSFILYECDKTTDKKAIVDRLANLSASSLYKFYEMSSLDNDDTIRFEAFVQDHGKTIMDAELVLNKKEQRLDSGRQLRCQKQQSDSGASYEAAKYFERFIKLVQHKELEKLNEAFVPDFVLTGCGRTLSREDIVEYLLNLPTGPSGAMYFPVRFAEADGNLLRMNVAVEVGPHLINADFILLRDGQMLENGIAHECKLRF